MTDYEKHRERLNVALSEVEEALDYFDDDEAFIIFTELSSKLKSCVDE